MKCLSQMIQIKNGRDLLATETTFSLSQESIHRYWSLTICLKVLTSEKLLWAQ